MSRFFKSAAFPILIVVVLAFFAQKLIGNSSHSRRTTRSGTCSRSCEDKQVKGLTLKEKDNTASVSRSAYGGTSTRSATPTSTRRR